MTKKRLLLTLLITTFFSYAHSKPIKISLKNLMNNYKNSVAQHSIRYGDCIQLSLNSSKKANILQGSNDSKKALLEISTKASELSWWIIKETDKSLNESRGKKVTTTSSVELIHLVSGKKLSYKDNNAILEEAHNSEKQTTWSIFSSKQEKKKIPIKIKNALSLKNTLSQQYIGLNEKGKKITTYKETSDQTTITITDVFFMHTINEEVDKTALLIHEKEPECLAVNEPNLTLQNQNELPLTPFTILREEESIGLQYRLQNEQDTRRMVQISDDYIHLKNNNFKDSHNAQWLLVPASDKTAQSGRFRLKNKATGGYISAPENKTSELSITYKESRGLLFSFTEATLEESEEATIITYGSTIKLSLQSQNKKLSIAHNDTLGFVAEENIEASPWKILLPNMPEYNFQKEGDPIRAGDLIRLQEVNSEKFLEGTFEATKQAIRFKQVALHMTKDQKSLNTHFMLSMPSQHKVLSKSAEKTFYLTHAATDSQIYFVPEEKKEGALKAKLSVTRNDEDVPTNISVEEVIELHAP